MVEQLHVRKFSPHAGQLSIICLFMADHVAGRRDALRGALSGLGYWATGLPPNGELIGERAGFRSIRPYCSTVPLGLSRKRLESLAEGSGKLCWKYVFGRGPEQSVASRSGGAGSSQKH